MSLSKNTLLLSFALVGFLLGTVAYYAIGWIVTYSGAWILWLPIPVLGPAFMSGIAGSVLSVILVYLAAHFSVEK